MATAAAELPISRVRRQRLKTFRTVFPLDVTRAPGPASNDSLSGPHRPPTSSNLTSTPSSYSSLRANRSTPITRSIAASASASASSPTAHAAASAPATPSGHNPGSLRRLFLQQQQQQQQQPQSQSQQPQQNADQPRWDRAWHTVTSRIQLPSSVAVEDSFGPLAPASQDQHRDGPFYDALALVLDAHIALPLASHTEDILTWHGLQARHHFVHHMVPLLAACAAGQGGDDSGVLIGIVETLDAAYRLYTYGLRLILRGFRDHGAADAAAASFFKDLHALVSNSWTPGLVQALRGVLQHTLRVLLSSAGPTLAVAASGQTRQRGRGLGRERQRERGREKARHTAQEVQRCRAGLYRLIDSSKKVGLAGEKFQVLFAEVMDACMQDFIRETYSGVWERPSTTTIDMGSRTRTRTRASIGTRTSIGEKSPGTGGTPMCVEHLANWIDNCYGRLAFEVISRLGADVKWSDVERWHEIAVGRLATLRMHELFDIVLSWPASAGGLDDLGFAVTTPQRRLQLTDTFSAALQRRLLHPGRSTLDILETYIAMIRTFHALDHSKVLLDRVVPALKLCLWMRDDAIRIVVTGLLANHGATADENRGKLVELAAILNADSQQDHQQRQHQHTDDEDLDWNNMAWVPDPVDAGANYRRPRNEDIIGTLINALGLEDVFIKEFQAIIAERLLSRQPAFEQEIKVLGLLKKRFGEAALQNCDVMTKDIMDSKRVDATLGRSLLHDDGNDSHENENEDDNGYNSGNKNGGRLPPTTPEFHAKILSRLFWPSLSEERFALPPPVAAVQRKYEAGFEKLKSHRKLSWLDHLGSARVRLELRDRTVEVECKTYEAAVIYEFQGVDDAHLEAGPSSLDSAPQRRHFNELWEKLMMDEDLLEGALGFWVSKRVLRDMGDRNFSVLESLDDDDDDGFTKDSNNNNNDNNNHDNTDMNRKIYGSTTTAAGSAAAAVAAAKNGQSGHETSTSPRRAKAESKEQERRTVYWQFIVGMLTNSSPAMPLGQIGMMMKMLIADGCAWGEEELAGFLAEKVAGGELEFVGGKYRLLRR